jgi:LacI family transcriptional regulator
MASDPVRRKKVTVAEIAQKAGVSKATVSFVLNNAVQAGAISAATRARVLAAAKSLGYRPNAAAKALATGRSSTILMVLFDRWDEHLTERLRGAEAHLVPAGYSLRVCTIDADAGLQTFLALLHTGQADGILLSGLASQEVDAVLPELAHTVKTAGLPMVAMSDSFPRKLVPYLATIADASGAQAAVRHLIEHGHRRIAFLGMTGQQWSLKRQQGYEKAMQEAGLKVPQSLLLSNASNQQDAYNAVKKLIAKQNFTALFCVTDSLAVAALAALRESGLHLPEDCAVVGFDNDERLARFCLPALTTVENPFFATGKLAARMLLDLIDQRQPEADLLPTFLVIRRSCGCQK